MVICNLTLFDTLYRAVTFAQQRRHQAMGYLKLYLQAKVQNKREQEESNFYFDAHSQHFQ